MQRALVGDSAQVVSDLLGVAPVACPADSLEHLRGSFPEGWSTASIDVAIEMLSAETAERLVYPMDAEDDPLCAATDERTEVGVDAQGRILWSVAVLGRTSLHLPAGLSPAGIEEAIEDSSVAEGTR